MKNFKQLRIWQQGLEIAVDRYRLVDSFPREERFTLASQITRAAVSIPSNIAEVSSRTSNKDYNRFLEISLGSSFELETQLLISKAANLGDKLLVENILNKIDEEQKMIMAFMRKLII